MTRLWSFPGGVKLAGEKALSNEAPVRELAPPQRVALPLKQHAGAAAEPVVAVGDRVDKGELVAAGRAFISASVHASVSGRVVAIDEYPIPHPSAVPEPCIIIESDAEERWAPSLVSHPDPEGVSAAEIKTLIREAGIVGLGGAVFPAAVKLKTPQPVDTLVVNGVECEPYITCDDALMRQRPEEIIRGALLSMRLVGASRCLVGVEDNKPEAAGALLDATARCREAGMPGAHAVEVVRVPTIFPAGGERQLVRTLTGRKVPPRALPYEAGVVCLNVGTIAAIYDAVYRGRPLVSRIVTVTGPGVRAPANFTVPLGTPLSALIEAAGGLTGENVELIMGGPMMGFALPDAGTMVVKGTNCLLVTPEPEAQPAPMPCIRCGSCAGACPMRLLPQQLYWHARGKNFDKLASYSLDSCIECGCCAVVCPSNIPLVSYFRFAKSEIADRERKRQRADESRARTQARESRLARQKQEQEAKKAARKAARHKSKPESKNKSNSAEADLASATGDGA